MDLITTELAEEAARLGALRNLDILDTPAEPRFDRIVRLASRLFDMPISVVSLIDETRQWFKAKVGVDASETPRSIAFCDHAIRGDNVMVVENAMQDRRFQANPLVTGDPNIRFYAGAPLRTGEGHKLGTLCVIDSKPRRFTPDQQQILSDLAALVVDEMELRRLNAELAHMAACDPLTRLFNRRRFFSLADTEWERVQRYHRPLSVLMIDIDKFKKINDRYGHDAGDTVIVQIARLCEVQKRQTDVAARLGGEEFVIMLPETDLIGALELGERLREAVARMPVKLAKDAILATVSIGAAEYTESDSVNEILRRADRALYKAKASGRNCVRGEPASSH